MKANVSPFAAQNSLPFATDSFCALTQLPFSAPYCADTEKVKGDSSFTAVVPQPDGTARITTTDTRLVNLLTIFMCSREVARSNPNDRAMGRLYVSVVQRPILADH
jgi:hypothetical protein